jgi:hypothetical protein
MQPDQASLLVKTDDAMEIDLPHQVADLKVAEAAFRTLESHSDHG